MPSVHDGLDGLRSRHGPGRFTFSILIAVTFGGAVGAGVRYAAEALNPSPVDSFPTGTFIVNTTGAFGLGLLLAVLARVRSPRFLTPLIGTGFWGAYTTFSTFAVEVARRLNDGHVALGVGYALLTLVVGLMLAAFGHALGRQVSGREGTPE